MDFKEFPFLQSESREVFLSKNSSNFSGSLGELGKGTVLRALANIALENDEDIEVHDHAIKVMDEIDKLRNFFICPQCLMDTYNEDTLGMVCPVCQIKMEMI